MAEKDIAEKTLESYNDVFADIVNGFLFNGEKRVKPNSLNDISPRAQYKADKGKLHEMERDVIKTWKNCGIELAVLGLENQTVDEKYMPMRVIGYDGMSYRNQLLEKKKSKRFTPMPVITMVLYFGTEHHWGYPKNLSALFKVPDGLEEYVNDYKINVFEVAWLSDEEIERFHSDFKIVARFFSKLRTDPEHAFDDKEEIEHVDAVLKLLAVMTRDSRFESILVKGKEIKTMCDVIDRLEKKATAETIKSPHRYVSQ